MQKNLNIDKIIFKVVQIKVLTMHITNQKLSFDIFTVENVLNISMEHDLNILMIFVITEKNYNFDPYSVLLAIATNIPVLRMTAYVLQGHIHFFTRHTTVYCVLSIAHLHFKVYSRPRLHITLHFNNNDLFNLSNNSKMNPNNIFILKIAFL